jgi:ribosomal protein L23
MKPVVTEKTVAMKDTYAFVVHGSATKKDVRQALKEFYGLEATSVRIINLPEKYRSAGRGRPTRKRSFTKKAVIGFPSGTTLDFNAFK